MKKAQHRIHTDYLYQCLDPLQFPKTVRDTVATIRKSGVRFDAIAFRGFSGGLLAPAVALRMKKGLIMVRKEHSHGYPVEGLKSSKSYIIIDDFIGMGSTITTIIESVAKFAPESNLSAIFLYKRKGDQYADRKSSWPRVTILGTQL